MRTSWPTGPVSSPSHLTQRARHTIGGTIYGMNKTTVYLPETLKQSLEREAARRGVSEAQVIRDAIEAFVAQAPRPRPTPGLFEDGAMDLTRLDDYLDGFGAS